MSLRLQMLQVARLAPRLLGDSTTLVADFLLRQFHQSGGACDRDGRPDLYYTIFALAGLDALQTAAPHASVKRFLDSFGDGAGLDLVHLGALARCWAAISAAGAPGTVADAILAHIERYRARDGGYAGAIGEDEGNAYACFVAFGAYQDLQRPLPVPMRMVQCLKLLETKDGAWANARGIKSGSTNATAAAVTLLRQLELPIHPMVGEWLLARSHPEGGFLAAPGAPLPDLLSTATTLHALSTIEVSLPEILRERCLNFIDTLWNAEGGFHGHWADDHLDAEYTFYGLLALGHLSV